MRDSTDTRNPLGDPPQAAATAVVAVNAATVVFDVHRRAVVGAGKAHAAAAGMTVLEDVGDVSRSAHASGRRSRRCAPCRGARSALASS
jgi:hypothetical protein